MRLVGRQQSQIATSMCRLLTVIQLVALCCSDFIKAHHHGDLARQTGPVLLHHATVVGTQLRFLHAHFAWTSGDGCLLTDIHDAVQSSFAVSHDILSYVTMILVLLQCIWGLCGGIGHHHHCDECV